MRMSRKKLILVGIIILIIVLFGLSKYSLGLGEKATLSWNAGDDNTAGYKIYYGTSPRIGNCPPGGYTENIDVGKVTRYNLDNLESEKTYYFSVSAYNSDKKESCFSEEMKKDMQSSRLSTIKAFFSSLFNKRY